MRITLVGSRHFGVTTFNTLRQHGVDIVRVVVADGEDRLAAAARAAGIEVAVQADPGLVVHSEIADGTDLIVTPAGEAPGRAVRDQRAEPPQVTSLPKQQAFRSNEPSSHVINPSQVT